MTVIHVPRPPKNAMNPERPVSSLLKMQVERLHEAERRLPLRYRSEIYVNAIKTESEAASYIREVTEAIHHAHGDAAARRGRHGLEIAAAADKRPAQKKKTTEKRGRKK
jgi:hypothetical protein